APLFKGGVQSPFMVLSSFRLFRSLISIAISHRQASRRTREQCFHTGRTRRSPPPDRFCFRGLTYQEAHRRIAGIHSLEGRGNCALLVTPSLTQLSFRHSSQRNEKTAMRAARPSIDTQEPH